MSQPVILPSNHAKHRMPRPLDKLYYLDLAFPKDDDAELVSPLPQTRLASTDSLT